METRSVELNICMTCNWSCPSCNRFCDIFRDTAVDTVMTIEEVRGILAELRAELDVDALTIIGGEPTLHPDCEAICRLVCETMAGHSRRIAVCTNNSRPDVVSRLRTIPGLHLRIDDAGGAATKDRKHENFYDLSGVHLGDHFDYRTCSHYPYGISVYKHRGAIRWYHCCNAQFVARLLDVEDEVSAFSLHDLLTKDRAAQYNGVLCRHCACRIGSRPGARDFKVVAKEFEAGYAKILQEAKEARGAREVAAMSSPDTLVTPLFTCRLANNILQVYRAFWFSVVHRLPRQNVVLAPSRYLEQSPLMANVMGNFVDASAYSRMVFDEEYDCRMKLHEEVRKDLFGMQLQSGRNVRISHSTFLYPELPWELALFAQLFDDESYRARVADKYCGVLCGNTVGYTVRRTDTVGHPLYRTLSLAKVVADCRSIVLRYHGLVRVVLASDDVAFLESVLASAPDIADRLYILRADEHETLVLLSLCDSVVCNGRHQSSCCWVNCPQTEYASTYGQVAQLLNRAYKFKSMPGTPYSGWHGPEVLSYTRLGCGGPYPVRPDGYVGGLPEGFKCSN